VLISGFSLYKVVCPPNIVGRPEIVIIIKHCERSLQRQE
jgi:hypothetical protein